MKIKWLDRRMANPGPYLCLCLSEKEYKQALRHLKVNSDEAWIKTPHADATAHLMSTQDGKHTCIICLRVKPDTTPVEIAGLLVHEAVHVVQNYFIHIGEDYPGKEQEAYAIQCVSQELMAEYARRIM